MNSKTTMKLTLGVFLAAAALWTSWNIWRYAVDIPFQDGWEFFYRYQAFKTGSFELSDLTSAHNEHRVFVPMALLTLNALLLDWNIKATLLFSVLLATLTAFVLIWLAYSTLRQRGVDHLLVCIVIVMQIFNMAQFANWLWEWDFQWFIANVLAVGTFVFLFVAMRRDTPSIYVALAALSAFAASFSLASGLCLWPLGFVYLLIEPRLRKFAVLWLIASVAVFALYFYGLPASKAPPAPSFGKWIPMIAEFTARLLGSTLDSKFVWGGVLIVVGAVASLFCLSSEDKRSRALPWIGIAAYAGGGALMAAVGRAHWLGPQEGSQTRYSTIAGIFVLAVAVIVVIAASRKMTRVAASAFAVVLVVQAAIHYPVGYAGFFWLSTRMADGRECLLRDSHDNDCVAKLYFAEGVQSVRDKWQRLRELNWRGTHENNSPSG
ncbi:hypothetical protein [Rhizobium tumorigenes]|uniref:hypothetical protein n=1 Tax=Rhizobium tumorigenes TaxID=2041385 RepID=UPI00241F99EA|nr:hypothetical protein [Rhizobium tumorigenes]WFS02146.1 hypothetical protein PR016_05905 [Rhizobium tumorigenes]